MSVPTANVDLQPMLTVQEVATILHTSVSSVKKLHENGILRGAAISSRQLRFKRSAVEAYITKQEEESQREKIVPKKKPRSVE